jgi:hypothetical protein
MRSCFLLFQIIALLLFSNPGIAQEKVKYKAVNYKFKLKTGDLLFQDLDCGGLCDAIESVTTGYNGSDFSHVGIVKVQPNGKVEVLEAIGPNVHYTPLEKFLNRQLDSENKPKVAVGRLHRSQQGLIPVAFVEAEKYIGKPYDDVFAIDNDAYYCSELVYYMFLKANNNQPLFALAPMTYADPDTKKTMPVWEDYFKKLNSRVPENEPGLNPGGISCSKQLKIFFPYGKPSIRKIKN